jgi:large subunit ribosomal protein L9
MSVQVILREPIENLGGRGDVVKVANGYARNYLLPRKLALPVTESNRRQVARERVVSDARDAAEKQAAEAFARRLARATVVVVRRVGQNDTLYGSVTNADIAAGLAEQSFEIDRRKIQLDEPLKQLGSHKVSIKVHRDVKTTITVRVVKEGAENDVVDDPEATAETGAAASDSDAAAAAAEE